MSANSWPVVTPSPSLVTCLSRCWIGLPLLAVFALAGCKPRQVCESEAYFEVMEPMRKTDTAPFAIDRPGRRIPRETLAELPTFLTFLNESHARTGWLSYGHVSSYAEVRYSPAEGLARNLKDPEDVFPMLRLVDASPERVRLGFRSTVCLDPSGGSCQTYGTEDLFLVADMVCEWRWR